jgi:NIPSNAP
MNRRSFAQYVGGAAMISAMTGARSSWAATRKQRLSLFRLEYLYLTHERQRIAVHDFLASQAALLRRYASELGMFTAITGPRVPATLILSGFTTFDDMDTSDAMIRRDAGFRHALEAMEKAAGQPYDRTTILLRPAALPSELSHISAVSQELRLFELRVYHSPSEPQLRSLHEQLAKPRCGIFARAGIQPLLQADAVAGPGLPNLTYLIPFAGLAERDKAWALAAADTKWNAAHESAERRDQVVTDISLLRPTSFSPMQ